MFRTYQAVLRPTARQAEALVRLLEAQRALYNAALEERIGAWRWERRTVSRFEQFSSLTGWDHPVLEFGVCPARGTLTRLSRAFDGFHRRVRGGQTPGFPRFKSTARWDSVEYPDRDSWRVVDHHGGVGRLHVQGVGSIRFRSAKRGLRGTPKTLTVRREGDRWRITVFCAYVPASPLEPVDTAVGIDVGVTESYSQRLTVIWSETHATFAEASIAWPICSGWSPVAHAALTVAGRRRVRSASCIATSPGSAAIRLMQCRGGSSIGTG